MGIAAEQEGGEHGDDVQESPDLYQLAENRPRECTAKKNPGEQTCGGPDSCRDQYSGHRPLSVRYPSAPAEAGVLGVPAHFLHRGPALSARHSLPVLGGNALHLRAVSGFAVARIASDHAFLIHEVQVPMLALRSHSSVPATDGNQVEQRRSRTPAWAR